MKRILFVTDLSFPGSAMASRLLAFIKLFYCLGYDIHLIAGKSDELESGRIYQGEDFTYEIVASNRSDRLMTYLGNENLIKAVDKYISENEVDFIFSTSLNALYRKLLKLCKKKGIKLILEQCEWYDPSSFGMGEYDIRYIRFNQNIKRYYKEADYIISISRLLDDYYKGIGAKSIRIPSIADVINKPRNYDIDNERIKLVFTGNTSNSKELIMPVLEALREYKDKIELHIYGSSMESLRKHVNNEELLNELSDCLYAHGIIKQKEVERVLLNSDYQIFIRPNRRSSDAGFPTKLCESMSVGTPCITNDTGDISLVLRDRKNGFMVKGNDVNAVRETFERIVKLDKDSYRQMRMIARSDAESFFDYRNYLNDVEGFLK